jgi:hypothetical protein
MVFWGLLAEFARLRPPDGPANEPSSTAISFMDNALREFQLTLGTMLALAQPLPERCCPVTAPANAGKSLIRREFG